MPVDACASCGSPTHDPFYRAPRVPLYPSLLYGSESEARGAAVVPVSIAYCSICGTVQHSQGSNDARHLGQIGELDGRTPRFQRFMRALIQNLVEKHELNDKRVLDWGAGRGHFVRALCESQGVLGYALDPFTKPDGLVEHAMGRVEHISANAVPGDMPPVDLITCRHTLNHLSTPRQTLHEMVRHLQRKPDASLFIEVPDAHRLLEDHAFWCVDASQRTYFCMESLGRLLEAEGLAVRDAYSGFSGQYIMLEAEMQKANESMEGSAHETPLDDLEQSVDHFATHVNYTIASWRALLDDYLHRRQRVVIWDAGPRATTLLNVLEIDTQIRGVVATHASHAGRFTPVTAHPTFAVDEMSQLRPDAVLLLNPVYRNEAQQRLAALDLYPELIVLGPRELPNLPTWSI